MMDQKIISLSILREYEKKDKRIKVIDQKNRGLQKQEIKESNISTGEFVAFIDNDDEIEEDYLEKFIEKIDENDDVVLVDIKEQ